ncbi:TPA: competence protein ComE, partial [Listeria monocytogenes]|nr:competence protein ComE [Listeria monocytogenes]
MLVLAIICANFTSSIVPICICLLGLIAFIKKSKIILLFVLIYLLTYSFLFVVEKFNISSFTATEYSGNCQI